jgi:hypothetical protein
MANRHHRLQNQQDETMRGFIIFCLVIGTLVAAGWSALSFLSYGLWAGTMADDLATGRIMAGAAGAQLIVLTIVASLKKKDP